MSIYCLQNHSVAKNVTHVNGVYVHVQVSVLRKLSYSHFVQKFQKFRYRGNRGGLSKVWP